jgi:hypothetical protein
MNLRLETRPVSSLKPYDKNAKRHGDEDIGLILSSINRFGFNDPIGILPDGTIVEGHGRYQAALIKGMESVPVLVLTDFTEKQADLYRIAHNKITLSTTFDFELLAGALSELVGPETDFTFDQLGFTDTLADNLLSMFAPDDAPRTRGGRSSPQEYDVIWDDGAQKKRFEKFLHELQARYPDLKQGEALLRFVEDSAFLAADQSIDTTGTQHEQH